MRYLNPSDIRQALSYEEMMAAVEEAFLLFAQGRCAMADRSALTQGSTTLATMPCFAGGYAATKLLASCPDNPRRTKCTKGFCRRRGKFFRPRGGKWDFRPLLYQSSVIIY